MKKVFCIFLSLIAPMGLSACEPETPGNPQIPDPEESSYLTFVSSGESSVALVKVGEPFDISLEYSIDGKSWNPYTIGEAIYLLKNEVSFRAGETGNEGFSKGKDNYYQFNISGEVAAKGNIMSLLDRNCTRNNVPANAFAFLFKDCQSLTSAPDLPAMNLAASCYYSMFESCTSLTETPTLSATVLTEGCYSTMFKGCTSLTEAPELPATELARWCYFHMFFGCTSLTKAPVLPATELAFGCYDNMFYGCTNLTEAPALPAMKMAEECYAGMFGRCTSLMKAPTLPATKLAKSCYEFMFIDCNSLTESPALPATELAPSCYANMFNTCMKLRTVPELPATNLVEGCYDHMFAYCVNLNYVKALFTDEPSEKTTCEWLGGIWTTGTFVKSKDATWNVRGVSGIPEGWTVITE